MSNWRRSGCIGVGFGVIVALAGCGAGGAGDRETEVVTTVEIALKKVPTAVHCVRVDATGSRTQSTAFDVIPGAASTLTMPGISLGSITFSGAAFNGACSTVTASSVPSWVATPTTQVVNAGVPASVTLSMFPAASAGVSVDFMLIAALPNSGLVTTEAGGKASFVVSLLAQPTATVTIPISSSDTTEGTVSPASLVFTTANWATPQPITITGVNDSIADGDIAYTVRLGAVTSSDPNYSGTDPNDVSVTNLDNDSAGYAVVPGASSVTTESGGTATFTLALRSQPSANVTVGITSRNAAEGMASPSSVLFTTSNWASGQLITVTGADDWVADGTVNYNVDLANAVSADPGYNGHFLQTLGFSNVDNDSAGVVLGPPGGLITTEAGGTATFTVALRSQPTANVTISLGSTNPGEGMASPGSLSFNASNWSQPQTVTVTGVDDTVRDGNISYDILFGGIASADPVYSGLSILPVSAINLDND